MEITFIVEEPLRDIAKACGVSTHGGGELDAPPCPFMVGDLVAFPDSAMVAFRVSWRLFCHASGERPAQWYLGLEKTAHPLAGPT